MPKGIFIVIEGSDGSGKGTQFKIIGDRLKEQGHEVATYDFPQYDQESSYFVREYLNGKYGDANELGAYVPSLFFALDRFQASQSIKKDLEAGKIVLSNRLTGANLAHQGQKIDDEAEKTKYYDWLYDLEFNILGIPKPDINIVLLVPAEIAQKLVDKKTARTYTDKKRDIHEADLNHLERSVAAYKKLCEQFPEQFIAIEGVKGDILLPIPEVTELIWHKIKSKIQ
ncbi:TPA: thymidylate kinase [Candidatus Saccharibacteria bacterium]|nr:MAG: thymidylate kinase, dTMP kinase [Candidatus Saccharibacteria bacterium GW2011_GWC2_44_17]MBH1956312.1 deoxynucleoside kinase [Candidatus Saccharibacteria bacterium]MBH1972700.1 deoxynucleoside kinase [Candidatus Saccharibacteria bacterium]MBH1990902.1 deoxynucleoside kinase [Candidatus Saccharibacteria bacterium]HBH77420.1 thymidylate kinase [Candidatus Saccharibacteria bacterium]